MTHDISNYDIPNQDDPYYENGNLVNYSQFEGESSFYSDTLLWGVCIVSFTYCSARLIGAWRTSPRDSRQELNESIVDDLSTVECSEINYDTTQSFDTCPICFSGYKKDEKLIQLKCSHIYHRECVFDWFKKNRVCPLCRLSV